MSMTELITKISLCLIAAAILGFLVGWLFSVLFKSEKSEKKYSALYDEYEVKESEIKQLHQDLTALQNSLNECEKKFNECEKELLNVQMDQESNERYIRQMKELESENQMLISQIKEQKLCEDENELLKDEIRVLEDEKQNLLDQIDTYKEYEHNYKALIVEIESLKSEKEKLQKQTLMVQKEDPLPKEEYEKIMQDVLMLKNEASDIKNKKEILEKTVIELKEELEEKNKIIQKLKLSEIDESERILPEDFDTGKEQNELDTEVCKEENKSENIKIKTLSQLIHDTLKEIRK